MPGKSTNGIDYEQAVRPLAVMPKEDPDAHVVLLHQYARGYSSTPSQASWKSRAITGYGWCCRARRKAPRQIPPLICAFG